MKILQFHTVVVGSGAAGYNAACRLHQYGVREIAILTEDVNAGTSRNAGSDKQTYYKLTLSGNSPDSVFEMAQTLFRGEAVDGDIALCEAALSAPSFLRLADLGVAFPKNRYGEYVGYKTDHDPRARGTSAGPYTSRIMTEALQEDAARREIPVLDGLQALRILIQNGRIAGLLCLDRKHADDPERRFTAVACADLILATGGSAGIYQDSVYPVSQFGGSALAFRAGVPGRNLTEWQYGLAAVSPRWNVSGTCMQALPRFVSTDEKKQDEREFLYDFFREEGALLSLVFLKGYQWPFDVRRTAEGSSIIDILVWLEKQKGRRVWLDYRENPGGRPVDYSLLSKEARTYLERAGACFGTPLDRLQRMNAPTVDFYASHGVDLRKDMLEISLCAQHHNGGIAVDDRWQTEIPGLFAVGEAAGTHGVYRPGGSALNAGQVGGIRAAEYIAAHPSLPPNPSVFQSVLEPALREVLQICQAALGSRDTLTPVWQKAQTRMSRVGAAFRSAEGIHQALQEVMEDLRTFPDKIQVSGPDHLYLVFRLEDMLLTQQICLAAMENYLQVHGMSRGSALYLDPEGTRLHPCLPEAFSYRLDDGSRADQLQEIRLVKGKPHAYWRKVHPIPQEDDFFENVWRAFRENGCMES